MRTFNEIASGIFKIREAELRDDMSSKDIPDWDSMNYLLFIAEVEKEFNVSLGMDEVLQARSLGDVKGALRSKGLRI